MRMIFYTIGLLCGIISVVWYGWLCIYIANVAHPLPHGVTATAFGAIAILLVVAFREKEE